MRRNIIIDCDPGQDDTIAIITALAHPEELNILGITTMAGNLTIQKTTENALKILEYTGFEQIPVASGYANPLLRDVKTASKIHGDSCLDGPMFKELKTEPLKIHAVDFIKNTLENAQEKVTIVATGPLTNIGLMLKTYPYLSEKIEQIVLMGGSIYTGNILPKAEFNIWQDPECAKMVFESEVPVVMAPMEACKEGCIHLDEAEKLANGGKISQLVHSICKFYAERCTENDDRTVTIFDLTTIIYLLHPEYFQTEDMIVSVELEGKTTRGMTVCDFRNRADHSKKHTKVLTHTDNRKYNDVLYEAIETLDKKFQ